MWAQLVLQICCGCCCCCNWFNCCAAVAVAPVVAALAVAASATSKYNWLFVGTSSWLQEKLVCVAEYVLVGVSQLEHPQSLFLSFSFPLSHSHYLCVCAFPLHLPAVIILAVLSPTCHIPHATAAALSALSSVLRKLLPAPSRYIGYFGLI